jgi:hypothetical protein
MLLGVLILPAPASALCTHPSTRIWILFQGGGDCNDTLWFGATWGWPSGHLATYGLDTALCEYEIAPIPPAGVCDARFVNKPGREGWDTPEGLGMGFQYDYRSFDLLQDTFRLQFQPGIAGYPVTFRWDPELVINSGDTVIIQEEFGGILFRVRMWISDHLVVTNPAITSLILIRFRAVVESAGEGGPSLRYALHPAYPNPFNPSTELRFDLPDRERVILVVYDLLGRKVATLADGVFEAGSYSATWDGSAFATGAYLARLTAVADQGGRIHTQSRKLLLVK